LSSILGIKIMPNLKIGALFAGYGGLDMAVSQVTGAELAWVCEWDDAPAKILATHYPDVPNYRDVSKVDWSAVKPVDILTGGFPCQDVSLAGARRGLKEGTRSGLWSEFAKAIDVIKPRLVVIENVRGLLSASAGGKLEHCSWCLGDESDEPSLRALGAVLGDLADLGYDARWQGVRAADAGAPHNRFRVFITAWPSDTNTNGDGFQPRGGYERTVTKTQPYRGLGLVTWADRAANNNLDLLSTPTTQDSSGRCRDHGGDLLHDVRCGCSRAERRLPTPKALDGVKGNLKTSKERIDAGHYVDLPNVANDLAGETNWGQYAPAIERWESVIGRPAPAPTKPDGRDGSHRLSSAFTEWMMGLPEGWVTGCGLSRNEELKACGNGVVPQQAVLALSILLEGVEL
jgi:DNA (cytosine-5)-methyltransferase 1